MRTAFFLAAIAAAMIAAPVYAQDTLAIGKSYKGALKLSSSNSGLYLALPEGDWILVSTEEKRGREANSPMISGRLVLLVEKAVKGVIDFETGNDSVNGWQIPSFCSRKNVFFITTPARKRGGEINCWGVDRSAMGHPSQNAARYVRDFYQWTSLNTGGIPPAMVMVQYNRASGPKWLKVLYLRNPEFDGVPRAPASTWQADKVVGDPRRLKYLEDVKTWGEAWFPTFEAAFHGRPK